MNYKHSLSTAKPHLLPAALVLALTSFLPVVLNASSRPEPVPVLFIAYDQGESNAFIRIQEELEKQRIQYRILAFGRAADLFHENRHNINLQALGNLTELKQNRHQKLEASQINSIVSRISPQIIYTGMASKVQAQILNAFGSSQHYSIAFYDNFEDVTSKDYVKPFLDELQSVNEFHVPSQITRESFLKLQKATGTTIKVTGQPVLESWDYIYEQTNTHLLRQQLGLSSEQPVVLFAGGYDTSYEESFGAFIRSTRQMPGITFLVSAHPKYNGELENEIINNLAGTNVRLILKNQFSTAVLSTIAKGLVVHKSSIAFQALYKGKPVVYMVDPSFDNELLKRNMAKRASTPAELKASITEILHSTDQPPSLKSLGIPEHSSQIISEILKNRQLESDNLITP